MIGAIEQAMIDRIVEAAGDASPLGYALSVASYAGELEDLTLTQIKSFPAVWVSYAGETQSREVGGGAYEYPATFDVVIAQQNRRNLSAARLGAMGKVGSYQIVEDLRQLLIHQTLGLDILPLRPVSVSPVRASSPAFVGVSVLKMTFGTTYIGNQPFAEGTDLFATFHADWDIPPVGNVVSPLPAAEADASDTIQPEQV